jgi:hypothetical protein
MTTSTTKGLVFCRAKTGLGVVHVGQLQDHFLVFVNASLSLDETALDALATISKALAAVVANLLVPDATSSLALEPSNYGCSFTLCVDANAAILVVDLCVVKSRDENEYNNKSDSSQRHRPSHLHLLHDTLGERVATQRLPCLLSSSLH